MRVVNCVMNCGAHKSSLMHAFGSFLQSVSQRKTCHDIQPIGGVRASPPEGSGGATKESAITPKIAIVARGSFRGRARAVKSER